MQCARCAGLSIPELIVEGGARIFAMRCLHCGDVVDHIILMNRRLQYGRLGQLRTAIREDHRPQLEETHIANQYRRADPELTP